MTRCLKSVSSGLLYLARTGLRKLEEGDGGERERERGGGWGVSLRIVSAGLEQEVHLIIPCSIKSK